MKLMETMGRSMVLYYLMVLGSFGICSSSLAFSLGGLGGGSPPPDLALTITSPSSEPVYMCTNASGTLDIAGGDFIPSYSWSQSASVTWKNDRGGGGTANMTNSAWTVTGVVLQPGTNVITVSLWVVAPGVSANGSVSITVIYVPVLDVTAPTSGQRWSNQVYTVEGTASTDWPVASVWCQLNNGPWQSTTGTTNWSATVNLTPGTNTVRVYALGTNGVASATNIVSFDYVVTNQLAVAVVGLGTVSPNYSNAWLEIGQYYSITPAPAKNLIFSGCWLSTNWVAASGSSKKTIRFMMESNLILRVVFSETNKPAIAISSPRNNYITATPLLFLKGTAADNWGISNVCYQLDGGTWHAAQSTNGWKNWTAALPLASGTHKIAVYSVGLGGNQSSITNINVVSVNSYKFQFSSLPANSKAGNPPNLGLQLAPGLQCSIEVSTNLINWVPLTNFAGSNSTINFHDPAAANFKQRYYRAVIPVQ